jgi:large subunit ribosomal protein L29
MAVEELRKMKRGDLQKLLTEKREEFRELRFRIASRSEKNTRKAGLLKREIAQILTLMREKELEGSDAIH